MPGRAGRRGLGADGRRRLRRGGSDDDDDATFTGGRVSCGAEPAPGGLEAGRQVHADSAEADWTFDHSSGDPPFTASWSGCHARHYFSADRSYLCGVRWDATGSSYVAQVQADDLVVRFEVERALTDDSCGLGLGDDTVFYRAAVPIDGGSILLLSSDAPFTPPAQMAFVADVPYTAQGDEPGVVTVVFGSRFEDGGP
jgi:hypothetical protein